MKQILKYILFTILGISLIYFSMIVYASWAIQPDPDNNTVYSEKYNDSIFTNNLIGKTEKELIEILGEPFEKDSIPFFHSLLIYQQNNARASENIGFRAVGNIGNSYNFIIDKDNIIIKDQTHLDSTKIDNQYIGQKLDVETLKKLGNKFHEIKCDCDCEVLSYTKMKDGRYRGKGPNYHDRNIILKDNKVVKVIKHNYQNNSLDQYLYEQVCEKYNLN